MIVFYIQLRTIMIAFLIKIEFHCNITTFNVALSFIRAKIIN